MGARAMWDEGIETVEACQPPDQHTGNSGKIDSDDIWWRIRRLMEGRRPARGAQPEGLAAGRRGAGRGRHGAHARRAESYLDRLPINFAITRGGREMAIAAMVRIALCEGCAGRLCA